ncbi:MAG TPA: ABC transporter permease subunit [Acidobacteriota bacterium]|nr:ABC transporter permease subunit [Acidobacteriota bacterium]
MSPVLALARKELSRLFATPVAYLLLAAFYLALGVVFLLLLEGLQSQFQQVAAEARQSGASAPAFDLPEALLEALIQVMGNLFLFLAPVLTMGFFAGESRQGTLELLLTSPLSALQIALGKYLAALLFLLLMTAPAFGLSLLLAGLSSPPLPWTSALLAPLGLLLLASAMLSLTLAVSSLTESQLLSAVLGFVLLTILWLLASFPWPLPSAAQDLFRYASLAHHFNDFTYGVLDTRHLIYWLSLTGLGLALTGLSLHQRRWRT